MIGSRPRYLKSAAAVAGGLLAAFAIIALLEPFGGVPLSDRFANDEASPETAAAPSTKPGEKSAVMSLHDSPRAVPELRFEDGKGTPLTLADFRGKVVLLNIWATWCGPCREEMPTLDRLQGTLGAPDFEVVALSIDRAGIGVVTEFYDEVGVEHLVSYIDESGKVARQLNAVGLPTTLLIDREGREIGRHVGPAEWDTPEMVAFFRQQLTRESDARLPGAAREWAGERADRPAVSAARTPVLKPVKLDLPVTGDTASPATSQGA